MTAQVAIIGAGPAGLMAAEVLSAAGVAVHVFDAMPSVGRKFLLAGKGGLNLTHAEAFDHFVTRYHAAQDRVEPWLRDFGPQQVRDWADGLGVQTFVGTSRRVFPAEMKAAPLLRAWLRRLRHPPSGGVPVRFHMRHRWLGWQDPPDTANDQHADASPTRSAITFHLESPAGPVRVQALAAVLALGGASWPRLGSDGAWAPLLAAHGVRVMPLVAANCGFDVAGPDDAGWTPFFSQRHAGHPFKSVAIRVQDAAGQVLFQRLGEFVATATGVEGSLIYAASHLLREQIAAHGRATLWLDLLPARTPEQVLAALKTPRGTQSLSNHLRRQLGLEGIKTALLNELLPRQTLQNQELLTQAIKGLPIDLIRTRPVAEAISSAGGVALDELDDGLQLRRLPGVFCAGEMLDWEAPTGGYLLTACLASGVRAARGVQGWLAGQR
ncbi:MAG: TIGR03862 family flavoprotein [Pseudomonadota bacterium]|nr:TIGR03862 family flavoprotein [Pseudomonadota bacterium]